MDKAENRNSGVQMDEAAAGELERGRTPPEAQADGKKPRKVKPGLLIAAAVCVVLAAAVAIVSLGGGQGGGSKKTLTEEMSAAAAARKTLVVGVTDQSYPPFVYMGYDGEYVGTDVELMEKVCDFYGWELQIEGINWTDRSTLLNMGQVDCLWSGFNSYGREDNYLWTDPYLDTSDIIVVQKSNKDITGLEHLEGKKVAVVKDTSAAYNLETFGIALTRLSCGSLEQCMTLLESGEADAVAVSITELAGLTNVKALPDYLDVQTYAVACGKDNQVLRDLIDYALAQVEQ